MTATEGEATATGDSPKAHYGKINDPRLSAEEMDERRKENLAYEYLCHLEEAKIWIEACIHEELAPTTELEESLRNGVALGKLAHFMAPDVVPIKRVYDRDQARFKARGLHFRHTDNINHWLHAMADIGHPKIFYPETTDIYDRKNMPRVIYCIHALSLYLFKLGKAPQIQDLYGKVKFTDEEINAMRQELEKYGIQMPAFSKIGGILANEMPVDEAALHAAVIAINEAIDQQNAADTLKALRLPAAHLVNVNDEPYQLYQTHLYQAKHTKAENARNKSLDPDSSYVPDVYDELLTQAELQGNINAVNVECVLRAIDDALVAHTLSALEEGLKSSVLQLRNVNHENMEVYMTALCDVKSHKDNNNLLTRDELQLCINRANTEADAHVQKRAALEQINEAVRSGDSEKIVKALCNPAAQLPSIHDDAAALYSHEFINIRAEKQEDLEYDEISGGVQVLSAIAEINRAVDMGDSSQTVSALNHEEAHIEAVDPTLHDKYLKQLKTAKASKRQSSCELLTHHEIQESISSINSQVNDEHQRILAVEAINEAVDAGDAAKTLQALQAPGAKLQDVETANNGSTYQRFLYIRKKKKQQDQNDNSAVLWYEEIQDTVIQSNALQQQGLMLSEAMTQLNTALHASQEPKVCACLVDPALYLHTVPACMGEYYTQLRLLLESKQHAGECGGGWMMNRLKEGHKFYYNTQTKEFAWERPAHVRKDHSLLTREEVQTCVNIVTKQHERDELFASNEGVVVRLQAAVRGNIVRKRLSSRLSFINSQLPAILKIQTWWRMARAKKRYKERKHYLYQQNNAVLVLQSAMRMYLIRKNYLNRMQYLRSHEAAAIKIQAFMRKNWAQQDYKHLMHGENPPLSVVRRFVHLLDQSDVDYSEEVELEKLRREVVTDIRNNQKLDSDLNEMDIKIGLLVKNRLTLQDVISQHKTLKRYRENSSSSLTASSSCHRGLKALSKASRERLEAYQHLFYLLQTNPTYLARLIFEMPQSKTTKFMESVILTLYNYASNQREEYLLLKLFKTALEEEISSKVDKLSDIVTGNPLVIKMIVSFNRNARGQSQLRELLHPLVSDVINDRGLVINTNPVEVYKQWINHMETVSGKPSGLAYDVTLSEALEHQEVQDRINHSLTKLKDATDRFLNAILDSIEKIPYGMRYMAKVLYESLKSQFPEALEKDLLKIVGNLIYYRYINSAIVAPDAFDIVDIGANKSLTNDQRRNLGSIAKILQFAASNKGFGGDSEHLACLNPYIMEAHNKFKKYFRKICDVEDPEVHFNMDQYTDVTRVTKPIIYISIAEIIETHKLLLDHQDHVAPDHSDPLHELLEDLGDSPEVDSLLGDDYISDDNVNKQQMSKTEISLTLSNKFEVPENDDTDMKSLLIRTKRMIVDVIRCQHGGDSLPKVLTTRASEHEENEHAMLIKRRERVDKRAASRKAKLVRHQSMLGDTRLPLETMKKHIERNLEQLERVHMVTSADNYQSLINSIVQDVRNQRYYRQRRKQEMMRLKTTLKSLATKKSFYNEQIEYYNQYVKTCLDNLSTRSRNKSKRSSLFSRDTDSKGIKTIKYSASKLHEKGIILEIEGLPNAQFKNMLFEIQSTEIAGKFEINTKFMGVHMDRVEVVFEDLLRMQYEGVAVMKMFDKAKINVNLLIFMLNKKFYGK